MRFAINCIVLALALGIAATSQTAIQPNTQFIVQTGTSSTCPQPFLTLIANETPGASTTCSGTDPQHCPPDGTTRTFVIAGQPWGGSVALYKNKTLLVEGTDFTYSPAATPLRPLGGQIMFATAPAPGDLLLATYMVLVNPAP